MVSAFQFPSVFSILNTRCIRLLGQYICHYEGLQARAVECVDRGGDHWFAAAFEGVDQADAVPYGTHES
jgi:hypothetical protein